MDAAVAVRGKIVRTKVKRYWPGQAPEWAADTADDDLDLRRTFHVAIEKAFPLHEDADAPDVKDDRLRAESSALTAEELPTGSRLIRQAEIVSAAEEEEDEEAQDERRRRIRERYLLREQEELLPQEEGEPAAEDDIVSSEYDTGSDEDEGTVTKIVKPVFLPKPLRDTIAERERIEEEERRLKELDNKKMEDRKAETRIIVAEAIRKEQQIEKTRDGEADIDIAAIVDTDDEVNGAEEYEAWKGREIARIKRGREQIKGRLSEKQETKPLAQPKKKWKFMQRYYHKGTFFQDEADDAAQTVGSYDIYLRDFSAATGEDKMDKSILPKVMQVRNFGRSGKVKWTGLVNEDTTNNWNNSLCTPCL